MDKEDKVIASIIAGFFVVIFGFAWFITSYEDDQPCSYFKNSSIKNVPVRCYSELNINKEVTP